MKITLVRHSSVECGAAVCYGQTDVNVAATFPEEAALVRQTLENYNFDAVFSSPLKRCVRLASFCGYKTPVLDDRLLELNFGTWENRPWDEIPVTEIEQWSQDWVNNRAGSGESFAMQVDRASSFLDDLQKSSSQSALIFTHAGIIRSVAIILGLVDIQKSFSDYPVSYGQCFNFSL